MQIYRMDDASLEKDGNIHFWMAKKYEDTPILIMVSSEAITDYMIVRNMRGSTKDGFRRFHVFFEHLADAVYCEDKGKGRSHMIIVSEDLQRFPKLS